MARRSMLIKISKSIILFVLVLAQSLTPLAVCAQGAPDEAIYRRFDEISALRANGEFDRAIGLLEGIVEEHAGSEEILRRAYNDLVFTILSKRSIAPDEEGRGALSAQARKRAGEALRRFPDLVADRHFFPAEVNVIYDGLRETMFGAVHITTNPSGCRVLLDGAYDGTSPVDIAYLPVGTYTLRISRSGYKDRVDSLEVIPGGIVQREVSFSKEHGRIWWLVRIVPALAASAAITAVLANGGDGGTAVKEFGLPPDPPVFPRPTP